MTEGARRNLVDATMHVRCGLSLDRLRCLGANPVGIGILHPKVCPSWLAIWMERRIFGCSADLRGSSWLPSKSRQVAKWPSGRVLGSHLGQQRSG
jgi:hypothetical protein